MATTENTYTGNGSLTTYSFTFPYLEESHVKVSLDGVDQLTTAYSFANATTINFNVAPSNGVAIRIYRQTDQEEPPATFFVGSAIRAQDLNDNFLQQLYVAQETAAIAVNLTAGDIAPGSISNTLLADNSVTSAKISDGNVTTAKINTNAVTTAKIADSNVTTAKIADANVTTAKLADGSVTASKIVDANVTTAKLADGSVTASKLASGAGVPPGAVFYFAASSAPAGYLEANGAAINRTTYADLFAVVGTTYGSGDGSTTFNLPDLRGEFIRGWDNGRGVDSGRSFGSFQADEFKAHTHSYSAGNYSNTAGTDANASRGPTAQTTGSTGGDETRPRNIALLPCIKY